MFGVSAGICGNQSGVIKSIQQVEITIAANSSSQAATISAVDLNRAVRVWNGTRSAETTHNIAEDEIRVEFTNSTTLTAFTNSVNTASSRIVRVTIVEFEPTIVKQVQHRKITLTNVTNANDTIASSPLATSAVFWSGCTGDKTNADYNYGKAVVTPVDATTINVRSGSAGTFSLTVCYDYVEFYSNVIQSIQSVVNTIATSASTQNSTISSVTTANCMLAYGGSRVDPAFINNVMGVTEGYAFLANATTVTHTRLSTTSLFQAIIAVTVIEFKAGIIKSRQTGQTSIATSNSQHDDTVTSSVVGRTLPVYLGKSVTDTTSGTTDNSIICGSTEIVNATTHRKKRSGSSGTYGLQISWEEIEFEEYPKL
jgi:hypothetical protein